MSGSASSCAIVGAAESRLGVCPAGTTPYDLMAEASARALDDCGLALTDVDGVFAATTQTRFATTGLCEYLGLRPRYQDSTQIGGASSLSHIAHAAAAIRLGLCEVALIAHASTQRSIGRAAASPREPNPYETPYRPFLPVTAYALAAKRHMHQYGTTRAQLAAVAVAARKWAMLNPAAWSRDPLTIEDVLSSRMISDPLTIRDCCLVSDGGGAIVLTSVERARDLHKVPIAVAGVAEMLSHHSISSMLDLTETAAVRTGREALAQAGLALSDIDVVELYDAFTINTVMFLEDLGFCGKGEGGALVEGGAIEPGGELPVNTNGGALSYCHPGMYGLLLVIEAVRQLRGEAGARQVVPCNAALVHANGGVFSTQATAVLARLRG